MWKNCIVLSILVISSSTVHAATFEVRECKPDWAGNCGRCSPTGLEHTPKVNSNNNSVLIIFSLKNNPSMSNVIVLEGCKVIDEDNWSCVDADFHYYPVRAGGVTWFKTEHGGTQTMINGNYKSTKSVTVVDKWKDRRLISTNSTITPGETCYLKKSWWAR